MQEIPICTVTMASARSVEDPTIETNSTDPGWQYGHLAPPTKGRKKNKRTQNIVCKLCGKVTSGGISRFKKHIAHIKGDVAPCPNSTDEIKGIVNEHMKLSQKKKLEKTAVYPKPPRGSKKKSKRKRKGKDNSSSEDEMLIRRKRQFRSSSRRFQDGKKLDTDVFQSFLEDLWGKISEEKRDSFAYFDSLWFSLYKEEHTRIKVLEWIKDKDIFSKKYIFVPIVCWGHWNLLILCNFGESNELETNKPCMLLLDSLFQNDPRRLEPDIRRFILDIYGSEGREENPKYIFDIPLFIPNVPKQTNGEECGSYVLYFIYLFLENAPNDFNLQDYPYFLKKDWFTQEDFENFSGEIESFSVSKKKVEAESRDASENDNSEECQIFINDKFIDID